MTSLETALLWPILAILIACMARAFWWATRPRADMLAEHYRRIERDFDR